MAKVKIWKLKFTADEKYGKDKWSNGCEFIRRVAAKNYKEAIRKVVVSEFENKICVTNEVKNKGLPIKYRNIELVSLELIAQED